MAKKYGVLVRFICFTVSVPPEAPVEFFPLLGFSNFVHLCKMYCPSYSPEHLLLHLHARVQHTYFRDGSQL